MRENGQKSDKLTNIRTLLDAREWSKVELIDKYPHFAWCLKNETGFEKVGFSPNRREKWGFLPLNLTDFKLLFEGVNSP